MKSTRNAITNDTHFHDLMKRQVPIQIYYEHKHNDIGLIRSVNLNYVQVNNTYYNRNLFTFISRPGF